MEIYNIKLKLIEFKTNTPITREIDGKIYKLLPDGTKEFIKDSQGTIKVKKKKYKI